MNPDEPQLAISRVLDAPRGLAFQAFTGPSNRGWLDKLDATLVQIQAAAADAEV